MADEPASPLQVDAHFEQGLGNITWWGLSPGEDFAKCITDAIPKDYDELFIPEVLLAGAGDGRHILASLDSKTEMRFTVCEPNLMLYARQMLFLALAQSSPQEQETLARQFVQLLGNINIDPDTFHVLQRFSRRLRGKVFAAQDGSKSDDNILPNLSLSRLKSKELDKLAEIFKFWESGAVETETNGSSSNGTTLFPWDQRNRQLLQDRYDAKTGVFEMDYNFRFLARGGGQVSAREYLEWRSTGQAFILNEGNEVQGSEGSIPNPTLFSTIVGRAQRDGRNKKVHLRGFWGDIITGPYLSYGFKYVESDMTESGRSARTTSTRTATQATIKQVQATLEKAKEEGVKWPKVTLLSPSWLEQDLLMKSKYHDSFHVAFIGCSVTHIVEKRFIPNLCLSSSICRPCVVMETPLYLLHIADEVQAREA